MYSNSWNYRQIKKKFTLNKYIIFVKYVYKKTKKRFVGIRQNKCVYNFINNQFKCKRNLGPSCA